MGRLTCKWHTTSHPFWLPDTSTYQTRWTESAWTKLSLLAQDKELTDCVLEATRRKIEELRTFDLASYVKKFFHHQQHQCLECCWCCFGSPDESATNLGIVGLEHLSAGDQRSSGRGLVALLCPQLRLQWKDRSWGPSPLPLSGYDGQEWSLLNFFPVFSLV